VYSTFDEASRAISASVTGESEPWELVRTEESAETWTLVLSGAGPTVPGPSALLRHYPPER
jgi:hypothetical protein